jgi:hypothetical protein
MMTEQHNSRSRAASAPAGDAAGSCPLTTPPVLGLELHAFERMALKLCAADAARALRAAADGEPVQCGRWLARVERGAHAERFWRNAYWLAHEIERFAMARFKPRQSGGTL